MKVKPKEGRRVLDESGRPIPAKGAEVPSTEFYNRLINDGDLVPVAKKGEK